jgi:hypothetical protein
LHCALTQSAFVSLNSARLLLVRGGAKTNNWTTNSFWGVVNQCCQNQHCEAFSVNEGSLDYIDFAFGRQQQGVFDGGSDIVIRQFKKCSLSM